MPKPLFSNLVAICAIGFLCLLFGCVYGISTNDRILCMLSILVGLCSMIRFLLLFRQIRSKSYRTLTGTCIKKIPSALFGKSQKVIFSTQDGKEYQFNLEKNVKLLSGHHYRLYFRLPLPHMEEDNYSPQDFLGFEEIPALTNSLDDKRNSEA